MSAKIDLKQTETFFRWRLRLTDNRLLAKVAARINRLAAGNAGDAKSVGQGVSEMRIDYGPGYRIYFTRRGDTVIILYAAATRAHRPKTSRLPEDWQRKGI